MGNSMNEAKKLDSRLISIALTITPIASWLFAVFSSPNLALAATEDDLKVRTSKIETTLTGSYANSSIGMCCEGRCTPHLSVHFNK